MRITKEVKQEIRQYILDAIDLEGYDQYKGIQMSEHDRLKAVWDIYLNEYGKHEKHYGSEQKTFENWLMGLPSCFNIDFENWKILQLSAKWGFIPEPKQFGDFTKSEQKILDQWYGRIYMAFRSMLNKPEKKAKQVRLTERQKQAFLMPYNLLA